MKIQFAHALDLLEQQGKPSIFRILMQPVSPTILHMPDTHLLPPVVEIPKVEEPAVPSPTVPLEPSPAVTLEPEPSPAVAPTTPETPKPVVFVTQMRYEFHTVVVLKKWWATLSCKHCKSVEPVGFPVTR